MRADGDSVVSTGRCVGTVPPKRDPPRQREQYDGRPGRRLGTFPSDAQDVASSVPETTARPTRAEWLIISPTRRAANEFCRRDAEQSDRLVTIAGLGWTFPPDSRNIPIPFLRLSTNRKPAGPLELPPRRGIRCRSIVSPNRTLRDPQRNPRLSHPVFLDAYRSVGTPRATEPRRDAGGGGGPRNPPVSLATG